MGGVGEVILRNEPNSVFLFKSWGAGKFTQSCGVG